MNVIFTKPDTAYTRTIAAICATGWRQTVEGKLSEEYKKKNVDSWYRHERVFNDINEGFYSHVALIDSEVVGVMVAE
ncbi:hypothetical protein [Virgibacillus sp. DJP39]|uniref:hypothetical protein n=1 Tax=Virgibacillus sp. DJP39 TaxID=3409790 RepID=UPI003BB7A43F